MNEPLQNKKWEVPPKDKRLRRGEFSRRIAESIKNIKNYEFTCSDVAEILIKNYEDLSTYDFNYIKQITTMQLKREAKLNIIQEAGKRDRSGATVYVYKNISMPDLQHGITYKSTELERYPFPLDDGSRCFLYLPRAMSDSEIKRLFNFIRALMNKEE